MAEDQFRWGQAGKLITGPYAQRISRESRKMVTEVKERTPLLRNHAYLAAGDSHMIVEQKGRSLFVNSFVGQPVNRFMPSVSVLFDSISKCSIVDRTIALMLTGMGSDGAVEMLNMRRAGAITIGQSQESCVVYGMPRSAAILGGTCFEADPSEIVDYLSGKIKRAV